MVLHPAGSMVHSRLFARPTKRLLVRRARHAGIVPKLYWLTVEGASREYSPNKWRNARNLSLNLLQQAARCRLILQKIRPWNQAEAACRDGSIQWALIGHTLWGDPLRCHKNFGHSFRFYSDPFVSPSKGWGLGKGTAIESPSPGSSLESLSSFTWFSKNTIVALRESTGGAAIRCSNSTGDW